MIKYLSIFLLFFGSVFGNDERTEKPIFVSLGSYCGPASLIQSSNYRIGSFPLDWSLSIDGEGVIKLIEEKFANFLNLQYLKVIPGGLLGNLYYNICFSHEGGYGEKEYWQKMPEFQEKMRRRIQRFLNLNASTVPVYFIRSAYSESANPLMPFRDKENIHISDEYALRLYEALKIPFPDLEYYLVILNPKEEDGIRKLTDHILILDEKNCEYIFPRID